jgi:integrase/recombinase XerD
MFERGERTLTSLLRHTGDVELTDIEPRHILSFLDQKPVATITWRLKYWILYRFFEYWSNREAISDFVMPVPRPFTKQTFVPYIFTKSDLRSLLRATIQNQKATVKIDGPTIRTLILFLYATGVSVGESTRILQSDLDLEEGLLRIGSIQGLRTRCIPIGRDCVRVLTEYVTWRSQISGPSQCFFVTKKGRELSIEKIAKNFQRLRKIAGIHRRGEDRYQPRVSDLRFTFAVHRITQWIEDGVDLNRMLPALAAYMGQVGLGSTERYLSMTPERFRKDLDKLSPLRGRGQWCSDPDLLQFLTRVDYQPDVEGYVTPISNGCSSR